MAFNEFTHAIDNQEPIENPAEGESPEAQIGDGEAGSSAEEQSSAQDPNELIRALENDRDQSRQQLRQQEFLNNLLMERQPSIEPIVPDNIQAILDKTAENDFITAAEARALNEYRESVMREDYDMKLMGVQEESFKKDHDDYDDVVNLLVLPAIKNNPRIWDMIRSSGNPAKAAYDYGTMQPLYQEFLRSEAESKANAKTGEVVDKISKNLSRPSTLGSAPIRGRAESDKVREILEMSDEDLEKRIADAKNR